MMEEKGFFVEEEYDGDELVGRVVYQISPIIWLTETKPGYRKKGIATRLLNKVSDKLKNDGYKFSYTFLLPDDERAINFTLKTIIK